MGLQDCRFSGAGTCCDLGVDAALHTVRAQVTTHLVVFEAAASSRLRVPCQAPDRV